MIFDSGVDRRRQVLFAWIPGNLDVGPAKAAEQAEFEIKERITFVPRTGRGNKQLR